MGLPALPLTSTNVSEGFDPKPLAAVSLAFTRPWTRPQLKFVVPVVPAVRLLAEARPKPAAADARHEAAVSRLEGLSRLADGWDDDEAPRPSADALGRAREALDRAATHGLFPEEVDADVLGGVALWFAAEGDKPERRAWIACMNEGRTTFVLTVDDKPVDGGKLTETAWHKLVAFVTDTP